MSDTNNSERDQRTCMAKGCDDPAVEVHIPVEHAVEYEPHDLCEEHAEMANKKLRDIPKDSGGDPNGPNHEHRWVVLGANDSNGGWVVLYECQGCDAWSYRTLEPVNRVPFRDGRVADSHNEKRSPSTGSDQ